jgi:plastocyanin
MIAFQGENGIYVINPDGTGLRRLTLGGRTPSWSPNSTMIVYEEYGITVMNADGSDISKRGPGYDPVWSPVGSMPPRPVPSLSIQVAGGDGQTDTVRATLAQPLSVRLLWDDGTPARGVSVNFLLSGSQIDPLGPSLPSAFATSDPSGIASVRLTLGAFPGRTTVRALVTNGTAHTAGVEFTATAKPGTPVALYRYSGGGQLAAVHATVGYAVYARDGHGYGPGAGNLVSGVPVTWAVTAGGGAIAPTQDTTAVTDIDPVTPLSYAVHTLGPDDGTATVMATAPTISAAPTVTFTTTVVTVVVAVYGFTASYWIGPSDSVAVPSGRTVGWVWNSGADSDDIHNITFEDDPTQPTSSPTQGNGAIFIRRFGGAPRTIRYRCTLHSTSFTQGEVGRVTVR